MTDEHGKMMKTTLSSRLKPPLGHLRRFSQLWLLLGCAVLLSMLVLPSRALLHIGIPRRGRTRPPSVLFDSEADYADTVVGWERYSMVPLPDSMLSTTLFVGNLCEFVHDGDLSHLFQSVSVLHSLPACVARKPNAQSLQYGFVAFPTVAEKEVRSPGSECPLKVAMAILKTAPICWTGSNCALRWLSVEGKATQGSVDSGSPHPRTGTRPGEASGLR